ncbi:MAG: hypothetical protein R6X18_10380 [Chloroflexota bacterium]
MAGLLPPPTELEAAGKLSAIAGAEFSNLLCSLIALPAFVKFA